MAGNGTAAEDRGPTGVETEGTAPPGRLRGGMGVPWGTGVPSTPGGSSWDREVMWWWKAAICSGVSMGMGIMPMGPMNGDALKAGKGGANPGAAMPMLGTPTGVACCPAWGRWVWRRRRTPLDFSCGASGSGSLLEEL